MFKKICILSLRISLNQTIVMEKKKIDTHSVLYYVVTSNRKSDSFNHRKIDRRIQISFRN